MQSTIKNIWTQSDLCKINKEQVVQFRQKNFKYFFAFMFTVGPL